MGDLVVSIRNSGTRFLKERLGIHSHIHVDVSWDELSRRVKRETLYAPMRRPEAIWRSWSNRIGPQRPFPEAKFVTGFLQMHTLSLLRNIDFIPVDLQEDERITDWTPVGHSGGQGGHRMMDLRPLNELPFVKEIYG